MDNRTTKARPHSQHPRVPLHVGAAPSEWDAPPAR